MIFQSNFTESYSKPKSTIKGLFKVELWQDYHGRVRIIQKPRTDKVKQERDSSKVKTIARKRKILRLRLRIKGRPVWRI